jgi:hypothetical protein
MAIWNILWKFGIFYDHLVHFVHFGAFFRFWYHVPIKIWQPCSLQTPNTLNLFIASIEILTSSVLSEPLESAEQKRFEQKGIIFYPT